MIVDNKFAILKAFENLEDCDILHVYAIVNFANGQETTIKDYAVNNLNIIQIGVCRGAAVNNTKETAVKLVDKNQQEYTFKFVSKMKFLTNDNIEELLKDKSVGLAFSVNKQWFPNTNTELFYAQNVDIQKVEYFKQELEEIDEVADAPIYFEIDLTSFDDIIKLTDCKLNFNFVNFCPNPEKVNWIEYTIPINAVYHKIAVFGDLKNTSTGKILKNQLLPLKFSERSSEGNSPTALPILCNLNSLSSPAQLNIKNFNINYQLPFCLMEKLINSNDPLNAMFDVFLGFPLDEIHEFDREIKEELIKLTIKLIVWTEVYKTNFYRWRGLVNEKNQEYIDLFNRLFANTNLEENNKVLIEEFLIKFPQMKNSLIWGVYKSFLLACSDFIWSPFCWNGQQDENYKNFLWYYINISNINQVIEYVFKKNITLNNFKNGLKILEIGRVDADDDKITENNSSTTNNQTLKPLLKSPLKFSFQSKFFDYVDSKLIYKNNTLINTNLTSSLGDINAVMTLPDSISSTDENWNPYEVSTNSSERIKYLCYLFFKSDIEEFVNKWFYGTQKSVIKDKKEFIYKINSRITEQDFQNLKPKFANNFSFKNFKEYKVEEITTYEDCGLTYDKAGGTDWWDVATWFFPKPARHGANHSSPNKCWVWYDDISTWKFIFMIGGSGPAGITAEWRGDLIEWWHNRNSDGREIRDAKKLKTDLLYSASALLSYDFDLKIFNTFYLQDQSNLIVLLKKYLDNVDLSTKIRFELDDEWVSHGWVIENVNFDKHWGFFNSANHLTINYNHINSDKSVVEKRLDYDLNFSFQKNMPTVCLTQNKY